MTHLYLLAPDDVDDSTMEETLALAMWLTRAPVETAQGRAIIRAGLDYVDALTLEVEARRVRGDG